MPLMFQDLARLFENARRVKLLKFFVFQPDIRVTAAGAGAVIGIPKTIAEYEVRALARSNILHVRHQKKQTLFSLNHAHPWLPALYALLDTTTLPDDRTIAAVFRGISGITLIIATGALARESRSSVDLLIVARKAKNPRIAKAVHTLEHATGLPLRFAVLSAADYAQRREARDRLLRDVFEFENRLILGHP